MIFARGFSSVLQTSRKRENPLESEPNNRPAQTIIEPKSKIY